MIILLIIMKMIKNYDFTFKNEKFNNDNDNFL